MISNSSMLTIWSRFVMMMYQEWRQQACFKNVAKFPLGRRAKFFNAQSHNRANHE